MDDNNLLMIILAFVIGYCLQGMMQNMCGRLVEGSFFDDIGSDFKNVLLLENAIKEFTISRVKNEVQKDGQIDGPFILPLLSTAAEGANMRAGAGGNLGGGTTCPSKEWIECYGGTCCLGSGACTKEKCTN